MRIPTLRVRVHGWWTGSNSWRACCIRRPSPGMGPSRLTAGWPERVSRFRTAQAARVLDCGAAEQGETEQLDRPWFRGQREPAEQAVRLVIDAGSEEQGIRIGSCISVRGGRIAELEGPQARVGNGVTG